MSEQRKERLLVAEGPLGAIETVSGAAIAQVLQVINDPLHVKRRANTLDLVASYNACLSMSDPEADVKALVEAVHGLAMKGLQSTRYRTDPEYKNEIDDAFLLLTRLRREP